MPMQVSDFNCVIAKLCLCDSYNKTLTYSVLIFPTNLHPHYFFLYKVIWPCLYQKCFQPANYTFLLEY